MLRPAGPVGAEGGVAQAVRPRIDQAFPPGLEPDPLARIDFDLEDRELHPLPPVLAGPRPAAQALRQSWTSRVQRNGNSAFIASSGGRRDRPRQRSSGPGARISPSKAPKQRVAASPAEPRTSSSVRSAKAARRRTWAMRPQAASSAAQASGVISAHGREAPAGARRAGGNLARPEGTRDVLARFRRPVGAAQKPAAADGPLDPPLEPAPRSSSASVIPAPTQAPISAGETRIGPKAAAEESMCSGARAFAAPSASATRVSPSLRSAVPSGG